MIEVVILQDDFIDVDVEFDEEVEVSIPEAEIIVKEEPKYDGPTIVIPSEDQQILLTGDHRLTNDITIAPIPKNYGRISWDGAYIRID